MTTARSAIKMPRRFIIFAPTPLNPQNPQNPQNPLNPLNFFRTQSRGSTPTGLTLKFESRDEWLGMSD